MKAKLYKAPNLDYYWLRVDEQIFAATDGPPLRSIDYWLDISDDTITKRQLSDLGMLSIKNCEAITNGYDLDELASERLLTRFDENSGYHKFVFVEAYKEGFQKALEILGDKKFSEKDMYGFADYSWKYSERTHPTYDEKSLQQTEWDVVILMGTNYRHIDCVDVGEHVSSKIVKDNEAPMLDKDGCLILKRK